MVLSLILAAVLLALPSPLHLDALVSASAELPQASPDVQRFIKEALEDRLAADAVAGYRLRGRPGKRVPILDHLPRSRARLSQHALPRFRDYEFYLVSTEDAQVQADRSGTHILYIRVDEPAVGENESSLWIGADVTFPSQSDAMKLCCCNERAHFRKDEGRWSFVRRSETLCY